MYNASLLLFQFTLLITGLVFRLKLVLLLFVSVSRASVVFCLLLYHMLCL